MVVGIQFVFEFDWMMKLLKAGLSPKRIMENLRMELIEAGCIPEHVQCFISEAIKHEVSEDFESSILTMVKGLKTASSPEEFKKQMDELQSKLFTRGYDPTALMQQISLYIVPDFNKLHQKNVQLMQELDLELKLKEEWKCLAEQRGISLFKLIFSVCISDTLFKLPGQLLGHFKNHFGTQAQWDTIYTKDVLTAVIGAFIGDNNNIDTSDLGPKSLFLLQVLDSFCISKSIPLQKNMLEGLKIKKERNIDTVHVQFTGLETTAKDIIKACHIFGDYSSLLNNEQIALIDDVWNIAKALGVYNKV